eukprot:197673-Rhodomonas_salina.2
MAPPSMICPSPPPSRSKCCSCVQSASIWYHLREFLYLASGMGAHRRRCIGSGSWSTNLAHYRGPVRPNVVMRLVPPYYLSAGYYGIAAVAGAQVDRRGDQVELSDARTFPGSGVSCVSSAQNIADTGDHESRLPQHLR